MILRYCPNSILIARQVSTAGGTDDVRDMRTRFQDKIRIALGSCPTYSGQGANKVLRFRSPGFGNAVQVRCHGGLIAT
jgi:hypothetical protein